ncbi:isoprenyl transferase [Egicoccus halophilus]|uniref:Isoprenyl transferase n=1 Tax=Egicoccus halophilus TaxID=1670830 RepID=A0A8J3EVF1_9ACTN|nr:isoprenyl transferase [Egicoccus halophilus]GGI09011.1 isoprenyl transferase [Egicoccus halophilus]
MGVADVAYRLYERRLADELAGGPLPQHVGVILDGNRRFARERGLDDPSHGHALGAAKIDHFLGWCLELGVPYVTLWLLSTDNLGRDHQEVSRLLSIIEETVHRLAEDGRGLRLTAVGALDLLPEDTRTALTEVERATAANDRLRVQVAVGYGGRQEIADALRKLLLARADEGRTLEDVAASLCPEDIGDHLYTTGLPDPDLIIRTSGEVRLSGFLLWQSAHSEYYFCDAYWPDFRRVDFLRALRDYQRRTRRYGR